MKLLGLILSVSVLAVAANDRADSHDKRNKRPVTEKVERSPGLPDEARELRDLDQSLRDFYEITGKAVPDAMPATGERPSAPLRSMGELGSR